MRRRYLKFKDGGGSGTSSGSEGNKENDPVLPATGLTRRQKKNHRVRREESASPGTVKKKTGHGRSKNGNNGYSKRFLKLGWNIPDMMLTQYLQNYLLGQDQLLWLGYPVESSIFPGQAIVLKRSRDAVLTTKNHPTGFDVNAREFVPKECIYASSLVERNTDPDLGPQISTSVSSCRRTNTIHEDNNRGEERKCVRCSKEFFVTQDGSYLTQEQCHYHWGRLKKQFDEHDTTVYECCRAKKNTKGCTTAKLHVWNGLQDNSINPLHGFVRTRSRKTPPPDGSDGAYALDCEMCFTTHGLELAKISVVGVDGRLVYDTYVKPENEIIDYNTRFSGVTAKEMNRRGAAKTLKEVQNDLMGFINADTIIIGHGVENDLIALKMIHSTVVDTSIVFPHYFGLPYRRSLKSLVECFLKRSIQGEATGHDSLEDARSCLELMFWKLRSDMGSPSPHSVLSNNRL